MASVDKVKVLYFKNQQKVSARTGLNEARFVIAWPETD
jgi:hypothetical protein